MTRSVLAEIDRYRPDTPLDEACTPPASWYVDPRILELELDTTFAATWQYACRLDQVREPGQFVTFELAGEPLLVVCGSDGVRARLLQRLPASCRGRGRAAARLPEAPALPVPRLDLHARGRAQGGAGVRRRARISIRPTTAWCRSRRPCGRTGCSCASRAKALRSRSPSAPRWWRRCAASDSPNLHWFERKHYVFDCNWKVFVDNYLDGGYHVPYLHEGLGSVLDYHKYTIENGRRHCLQSSPMVTRGAEAATGAVRKGERALYYWFYPNFMVNWYEGVMDTNLVYPRGVHQTEVIFDFWFADVSDEARAFNRASIDIANRVQDEDEGICRSVQRGLRSRAYDTGRLSVRREAGEQLFHQLLHADLKAGAVRELMP